MKLGRFVKINKIESEKGMTFIYDESFGEFQIKRFFIMSEMNEKTIRGQHANKTSKMVIIPLVGSCDVEITNTENVTESYKLDRADEGLFVDSGLWRELKNFGSQSIILVLTDALYDPTEYITSMDEFLRSK